MTQPTDLRVTLWQCSPLATDTTDVVLSNLARLDHALHSVAGKSDLLITPEMFVCGYHLNAAQARERADPVAGPVASAISRMCATHRVAVLYGCAELGDDGLVYNAIRLVDAGGRHVAAHRKTHLFGQLDRQMVTPGTQPPPIVDVLGWQIGVLICYEVEFAEMVRSLAVRGADIVCVPTANMPEYDEVQRILLPARALESQVYVAYANYVGTGDGLAYGGLSEVVGPSGEVMADAGRTEQLLSATAVRSELAQSRSTRTYMDDRRPELY